MEEKDPTPEIKGRLEALLFVATKTASTKALARGLDLPEPQVAELLKELAQDLEAPNRVVRLRNVAGRWRLETKPEHASAIAACDSHLVARPLTAQPAERGWRAGTHDCISLHVFAVLWQSPATM